MPGDASLVDAAAYVGVRWRRDTSIALVVDRFVALAHTRATVLSARAARLAPSDPAVVAGQVVANAAPPELGRAWRGATRPPATFLVSPHFMVLCPQFAGIFCRG